MRCSDHRRLGITPDPEGNCKYFEEMLPLRLEKCNLFSRNKFLDKRIRAALVVETALFKLAIARIMAVLIRQLGQYIHRFDMLSRPWRAQPVNVSIQIK